MIAPPRPPAHDELEALIKEARERQLRRRLLGAAAVATAAALGLGMYAATGGSKHAGTASRGGPLAAVAACSATAGWRLRLDGLWSEPTEQNTAPLEVTRIGRQSCSLHGYPQIVLLGAGGHTLDFRYNHRGDVVVARRSPRVVSVASGSSAFFLLNKNSCISRERNIARWVRVRLPGVRGQLVLRLPHYPLLGYCPMKFPHGKIDPGKVITVSPIVSSFARAAARLP